MLSVAIITFNEEKNIARCLESVKHLATEIVVVDSFSTDNTESICNEYGVKFIKKHFLGYMEQKKLAVEYCKFDFVLSLDADECLSTELISLIEKEKLEGFTTDSYTMKRCTNFCGNWIKNGSWYPDKKIRLFNKQKGNWGGLTIHESVKMKNGSTNKLLKADILHYSYYSVEEFIIKSDKYTSIQAQAMLQQNKKSSWVKILLNPIVAFIQGYFVKRGFLDGWDGYFIAKTIAYFTRVKYLKLLRLQQNKSNH